MQLNNWMAQYMPQAYRGIRDFESGDGWVGSLNLLLKKLERNKLFETTKRKERGVEVDSDYWITPPSDLRELFKIYNPYNKKQFYSWEYLNGKIRIDRKVTKEASPDTFTLSDGTTTTIKINDADATADLWNEYLLVLTDGTYSGDTIIIHDTAAADGGTSVLTFRHAQSGAIDSTTGYLTNDYVMMKYKSTFTQISTYSGEIPLDDKYEGELLKYWFEMDSLAVTDKKFNIIKALFEEVFDEIKKEQRTATPDQFRSDPIQWPGFAMSDNVDYHDYEVDKDWED